MFVPVPPPPGPPLIIVDGGLGGLSACWAECVCRPDRRRSDPAEPRGIAFFPLGPGAPGRERRLRAVRLQADLCGMSVVEGTLDQAAPRGFAASRLLLAAAEVAALSGITRIIWPVHPGSRARRTPGPGPDQDGVDLDAAADICDRAMLVGLLARIDGEGGPAPRGGGGPMTIETPYADFSDYRLAAHAVDLDAPLWACWWCEHDADAMCGRCRACERTMAALRRAAGGLAERLVRAPDEPPCTPAPPAVSNRRAAAVVSAGDG
jgi:hypothetical protein